MKPQLLEVQDLSISFRTAARAVTAVEGLSFRLEAGETLGLVGESGCGKSVTSLSLLGLLPPQTQLAGSIRFEGRELLTLPEEELRRLRGDRLSMVFQEPMTSLNPVYTIGRQLDEVVLLHRQASAREARERTLEMLRQVGIPRAAEVCGEYPHQLSGGMRQRVMIAMALACSPALLIADEPTTALDVTIQAQILEVLRQLRRQTGTSILLITHDLGVVAEMCDRVLVMYAGQLVEEAGVEELFTRPCHPYTQGLLHSIPRHDRPVARLQPIGGQVPPLGQMPPGCRFAPRCLRALPACSVQAPPLRALAPGRRCRCWLTGEGREEDAVAGREGTEKIL